MFVQAAAKIDGIAAQRNSAGQAGAELPPVMPKQLVVIDMPAFVEILGKHKEQLHTVYSEEDTDNISEKLSELTRLYRMNCRQRQAVDSCSDELTSFTNAWSLFDGEFRTLRAFCGGLASTFANTTMVESDFSHINWEKDDSRTSLSNFSLEGILHCKQYAKLKALEAYLKE